MSTKPNRYQKYLASPEWKAVRDQVMRRAGGQCEREGCTRRAKQVHHKTYEGLGAETLRDIEALCGLCHTKEHPDKAPLKNSPFHVQQDCPQCGHRYATLTLGRSRRFKCNDCGIAWTLPRGAKAGKENGSRGKRVRRAVPRLRCPVCDKSIGGGDGLHQHMASKHPDG